MCLETKAKQYEIVQTDMIVYKHVIKREDGSFISPYKKANVTFGCLLTSKLTPFADLSVYGVGDDAYVFVSHGFHSFLSADDAYEDLNDFIDPYAHRYSIPHVARYVCECVIPKGAAIVRGTFEDKLDSIVSDKIIYVKTLK